MKRTNFSSGKLLKSFVNGAVQIVLHSRLGNKLTDKESKKTELFGLIVRNVNIPSVQSELKHIFSDNFQDDNFYLGIEILLMFDDGECKLLENWVIEIVPDRNAREDAAAAACAQVNTLLKSLIAITRLTPAYRVIKNLDADTCKARYRIRTDGSDAGRLPKDAVRINLRRRYDSIGDISVSVYYLNDMSKSPSEDFRTDPVVESTESETSIRVDFSVPMKMGAFVDKPDVDVSDVSFPEEPSLKWLLKFSSSPDLEGICETEDNEEESQSNLEKSECSENDTIFCNNDHDVIPVWDSLRDDPDDKFKFELNCAFAERSAIAELANFSRNFDIPVKLRSLESSPLQEIETCEGDDIEEKLDTYEKATKIYDKMINELM